MGLEARRVPVGFEHPTRQVQDRSGRMQTRFVPCSDSTFSEASAEYERNRKAWMAGTHPDQKRYRNTPRTYEEWAGEPPEPEGHLPEDFDRAAATGWCLYEDVSEGTPVTPVFATREELVQHLATKGAGPWGRMSREAAEEIVDNGAVTGTTDADGWHDAVGSAELAARGR